MSTGTVLREHADRLTIAGGAAVLVEGVAGIGKTALLRAFSEELSGRLPLLRSHASELELDLAFGAARQLLTGAVLELADADRDDLLSGPGSPAAAALGLGEAASNTVDPLYSLFWVVAGLAERQPLVLLLDDGQWWDPDSARFVGYLARRVQDMPVLLVATARTQGATSAVPEGIAALREVATVLRPAPLSEAASATLVDHPDAYQITGGNPLLLQQLARSPDTATSLAEAVIERIRRISPDALAFTEALSLFASGASLGVAAQTAGLDLSAAATAADALVEEQILVVSDGALGFTHPMLRSTLYDGLGTFARSAGHVRAAAALRSRGASIEQVAAQLLAGEPAGDPDSVELLRAAASAATANLAPRAAARYLERAVAEGGATGSDLVQLLVDLGRLQRRNGENEKAQQTFTRAYAEPGAGIPNSGLAVDLALSAYLNSDHRMVCKVAADLQYDSVDPDDQLAVKMLMAESAWNSGDAETCMRLITEVPEDLPGTTPAQRFALAMIGTAQVFRCEPLDAARNTLLRAVGEDGTANLIGGIEIGDPFGWIILSDALDEAEEIAARRLDRARASGDEALFAWTQNTVGWLQTSRGDLAVAEAAFRLGMDQPSLNPILRVQLVINLAEVLICRGTFDEAANLLDGLDSSLSPQQKLQIGCRRSQIAVWRGDYVSAISSFERRYADEEAAGLRNPNARIWVPDYLDALAGVGRRDEAVAIARELVELSRRTGGASGAGYHQLSLGRLTGDIAAIERAVEILEPSPFRWYAARAQLEFGAALRREGQRVRARDHLRRALDYAERNKVRHFSERAREELRLAGAKPRKLVLTGIDALTPAELRIALLAAEGRSNKEIAQHLFLTVKTIEATLARAFRKLQVSSRRELAGILG